MDADQREYFLVVGFESREAYVANANSPEQHERYLRFRELLESDPEWHDGEIPYSHQRNAPPLRRPIHSRQARGRSLAGEARRVLAASGLTRRWSSGSVEAMAGQGPSA